MSKLNFLELRNLQRTMSKADSLAQWRELALKHDLLSGAEDWKSLEDSNLFNARKVKIRCQLLEGLSEKGDSEEALFVLNEGIHGNMGGMGKGALYNQSKLGTKNIITRYVKAINESLKLVADAPESEITFDEKLDFFRRARSCFGSSALSLSGGSGLIYFHHGVIDSLLEDHLLPKVISGSSAGSWMCAQIGTRTDEELKGHFAKQRYNFKSASNFKSMFDLIRGNNRELIANERDDVIDEFVDNMTFQEAFEHTGRYINVSIAPAERYQNSRLMNALTSPNVTIRSAVKASSSVPGMVDPVALEAKDSQGRLKPYLSNSRWVDGSFGEDLPFKRLSRLFGVNHYIVSMINPIATPFLSDDPKTSPDTIMRSMRALTHTAMKESIKTARRWSSPVVRNRADAFLGMLYKLMDQQYVGDINIIMKASSVRQRNMLFKFNDDEEIQKLILDGKRATWPKLDQIRNSISIRTTIDEIIEPLEEEALVKAHSSPKKHMVI